MEMFSSVCFILYLLEGYNAVAHFLVLTGWRRLPRKDLVKVRYYFLADAAVTAIAFCLHQNSIFLPFLLLQQWQHAAYFFTWDESASAKRVISWSSLDWDRGRWNQLDLVTGTLFDLVCHLVNIYLLAEHLSLVSQVTALALTALLTNTVLFNKQFAWSSKEKMPDWVKKRVNTLTQEQRQEITVLERLSG